MIRLIIGAFVLALPLAACGTPEAQNVEVTTQETPEGGFANAMRGLPEGQRNATLYRAIVDAERECQQVDRSQEVEPVNGTPTWTATCETGVTWVVILNESGIATVTNAAEIQAAQEQR